MSLAALLGPFWLSQFGPSASFTVGTVLVLIVVLLIGLDIQKYRPPLEPFALRALLVIFAMIGFLLWALINAVLWGCTCGAFHGLADLVGATLLAVAVGAFAPAYRSHVLSGAVGGLVLAAMLAIAGVRTLHSPFGNTTASTSTQLAGIYGNPNYLGYALAFAVPVIVVWISRCRWRTRLGLLALLSFVVLALGLTFSRGGLLAAALGGLAALTTLARTRRMRAAVLLVGFGTVAVAAAVALPFYNKHRKLAVFGAETITALDARDASGWDGGPQGLISGCCSSLSNVHSDTVLRVAPSRSDAGVSRAWGMARAHQRYELTFRVRSMEEDVPIKYALEDNKHANGTVVATARVGLEWRLLKLQWVPIAISPAARLYVWQTQSHTPFYLTNIRIVTHPADRGTALSRILPTKLAGFPQKQKATDLNRRLNSFIDERVAGVRLAVDAFVGNPIRGIGWENFPRYASAHRSGNIPTHNEYMRIASELGLPGVCFFALIGVATWRGLREYRDVRSFRAAAAGVITAGAVGLFFVNGLTVSAASLPLALTIGLVCAPRLDPETVALETPQHLRTPTDESPRNTQTVRHSHRE